MPPQFLLRQATFLSLPFWTFWAQVWCSQLLFCSSVSRILHLSGQVFSRGVIDTTAIMKSKRGIFTLKGGNSDVIVTLVQC